MKMKTVQVLKILKQQLYKNLNPQLQLLILRKILITTVNLLSRRSMIIVTIMKAQALRFLEPYLNHIMLLLSQICKSSVENNSS